MAAHLSVGLDVRIWIMIFGPGAASTSFLESTGAKSRFGSFSWLSIGRKVEIRGVNINVRDDHLRVVRFSISFDLCRDK